MAGWDESTTAKPEVEPKQEIEFKTLSEAEDKRGLKIGLYGNFATGKTHFCLTTPEPVFILDTEMGSAPLAYNFPGKDIRVLDVAEKDGSTSYQKILEAIDYISKQDVVGTIVLDSTTDLWEFAQEYAKVNIFKIKPEDRLKQQWDWGQINKVYMKVLMKLLRIDCNLVLTAREGEIFAGAGQPTSQVKPKWQKTTGHWVDIVIHNVNKIDKSTGKSSFTSVVEKCRQNGEIQGKRFGNLDFKKLEEELNSEKVQK